MVLTIFFETGSQYIAELVLSSQLARQTSQDSQVQIQPEGVGRKGD